MKFFRTPLPGIIYDEVEKWLGVELTKALHVRIRYWGF